MSEDDEITPARSSNVGGYRYDAAKQELHVRFNSGGRYVYEGVPQSTYDELTAAESPGGYLQRNVAKSFPFRRADTPAE